MMRRLRYDKKDSNTILYLRFLSLNCNEGGQSRSWLPKNPLECSARREKVPYMTEIYQRKSLFPPTTTVKRLFIVAS